jgi:hypothetical protein
MTSLSKLALIQPCIPGAPAERRSVVALTLAPLLRATGPVHSALAHRPSCSVPVQSLSARPTRPRTCTLFAAGVPQPPTASGHAIGPWRKSQSRATASSRRAREVAGASERPSSGHAHYPAGIRPHSGVVGKRLIPHARGHLRQALSFRSTAFSKSITWCSPLQHMMVWGTMLADGWLMLAVSRRCSIIPPGRHHVAKRSQSSRVLWTECRIDPSKGQGQHSSRLPLPTLP